MGYSRLSAAHLGRHHNAAAISTYRKGLKIGPKYEFFKFGLVDAQSSVTRSPPPPSHYRPLHLGISFLGLRCGPSSPPIRPRGLFYSSSIS
ncbi:hypothetical protein U1Q18_007766 [Sarracenia purpurea var. burkii]